MPLTINLGLNKKVGLPQFGSVGASCNIQLEADHDLLHDLDSLHSKIKLAYVACSQAVNDELYRQQSANNGEPANAAPRTGSTSHSNVRTARSHSNGNGSHGNGRSKPRAATASQVRALHAIANKQSLDLEDLLTQRFQVATPDDLSITDASNLIDELNANTSQSRS